VYAYRSKTLGNAYPLLPWNWSAEHPESIRTYRQDGRRDREIRKREKRQRRRDEQERQPKLDQQ